MRRHGRQPWGDWYRNIAYVSSPNQHKSPAGAKVYFTFTGLAAGEVLRLVCTNGTLFWDCITF